MRRLIDRFAQRSVACVPLEVGAPSAAMVIRLARDEDQPLLRELAGLDSADLLAGPALIAVVDGRPWAAYGLDDDRVIADPFAPSAEAVGLLRLRVGQLRASQDGPRFGRWRQPRRRAAGVPAGDLDRATRGRR